SLTLVGAVLVLAACSGPGPAAQGPAKTTEPADRATAVEQPRPDQARPVTDERSVQAEQPRVSSSAAAKPKPAVRETRRQANPPVVSSAPRTPTSSPAPAATRTQDTVAGGPGTLTLPAPVAPPIAVPAAPPDDIKETKPPAEEPPAPRE